MNSTRSHAIRYIVASALIAVSCISSAAPAGAVERIHANVSWLADSARQGRRAGSEGAADSATYISNQFRQLGYDVRLQEFGGNRRNVVARLGNSARTIIAGAHYDGQGPGFPSASDNAAGTAVLIELARDLGTAKLPVSVVMVAFDDEEQGLNGSKYFADHSPVDLENVDAAIVFDALGRHFIDLREWTTIVLGTEYSAELSAVVQRHWKKDMLNIGADLIGPRSDFAAFGDKRVPFLFFSDGTYSDYHGAGDTPERVDYIRLSGESQMIGAIIRDVARMKSKPMFRAAVYPEGEVDAMLRMIRWTGSEKKDLPPAYRQTFDLLKAQLPMDTSRESLRIATSTLLAVATPEHAHFFLDYELEPYFESIHKPEIAEALRKESERSGK
jgi:peptidase M28-like protein